MRVLHFFKTYLPDSYGGIEQVINQIVRGSGKYGVDTDVLTLTKHTESVIELEGHTVYRAKENFNVASTGISLSVFSHFSRLARRADVIHYHFPWPLMDLIHFATLHNKPTLLTYHSDIVKQKRLLRLYKPLQYRFLMSVDRIVATSPNYLASSEVLTKFVDKVDVIPIGLDKSLYPIPSECRFRFWRNRFGTKFFLFIGVLRYYKGLNILVQAARKANYPIVIVGAGPVEQELKQQAKAAGVEHVHFLGRLDDDDKVALLKLCFAVVFPSHLRAEAFGVTLLEGAMCAKPMISSEIGTGTSFVNISNNTGLVIPPANADALAIAMKWLWEHPDEAKEMGARAERRYQELFTANTMVDKYNTIYRELHGQ